MSIRLRHRPWWRILPASVLGACSGIQTALDPAGNGAQAIHRVWLLLFWVCAAVWVLVVMAVLWAMLRRRGDYDTATSPEPQPYAPAERRL
jgi:cytochrome c oxidase subunit II